MMLHDLKLKRVFFVSILSSWTSKADNITTIAVLFENTEDIDPKAGAPGSSHSFADLIAYI